MAKINYAKIMQSPNEMWGQKTTSDWIVQIDAKYLQIVWVALFDSKLINLLNYRPRWKPKLGLTSR